ncbi:hypothetical protein GH714_012927 [Hevea brasiliensis]|uniref:Anthranilate synthase n=1 Tax=Hevea brasiliensis TaxID=3981 RepID=A0A6A6MYM2_HEVBR|nr:hypothetical protein GH714_012927 [Hevea brasiliensis]
MSNSNGNFHAVPKLGSSSHSVQHDIRSPERVDALPRRSRRPYHGWISSDDEEELVELTPAPFHETLAKILYTTDVSRIAREDGTGEWFMREKEGHEGGEAAATPDSLGQSNTQPDSQPTVVNQINNNGGETNAEGGTQDPDAVEVASGSPLPGVNVIIIVADGVRFAEAAKNGNLVPLHYCIFSDQLTPVTAYRCLVKEDDREAPSFLFESVEPGFQVSSVGRYSVVGAQPAIEIVAKENKVTIMDHEEGSLTEEFVEDPMTIPRSISEGWKPQIITELPDTFCGGWVGYFSYDTVRYVEKKKLPFSSAPKDDRDLADIHLGLYDDVIVFDHVEKGEIFGSYRPLCRCSPEATGMKENESPCDPLVRMERHSSVEDAYSDGIKRLGKLLTRVQDINPPGVYSSSSSPEILTRVKKMRAMQLLDHYEVNRRGPYSGGFGGVSFLGDMDIALGLRTIVFPTGAQYNTMYLYRNADIRNEWIAYLQAGAGIVADSDPEEEHRECQNKAAGLARAIDLAESAFIDKPVTQKSIYMLS